LHSGPRPPGSVEDQQRLCDAKIARDVPDAGRLRHFADAGISGASVLMRPGLRALLRAASHGECQIAVAESLDRLSRNQADIATIYQLLTFHGVRVLTCEEGIVDEMVIGFRGTMSAMFLKSLAAKTRRGLIGQVERGKMAGGLSYGYTVPEVGTWAALPEQQAVIVRIFTDYANGVGPMAIAQRLNRVGVRGRMLPVESEHHPWPPAARDRPAEQWAICRAATCGPSSSS
jgi:DNA invertase Pin-like site-specific DNA recombinase